MKRVVFSTDFNQDYAFFLPITSLVWKSFTDYSPVCFLIASEEEWKQKPLNSFILDKAKEIGVELHYVGKVEDTRDSTVAQVSRIFSGCLDIDDDEYVLTSDVDMLPLNRQWYNQGDPNLDMHLYFANANKHERYPICYLGGQAKIWREVMSVVRNTPINAELNNVILGNLGRNAEKRESWDYDETLFVQKVKQWNGYPQRCHMIDRPQTAKGPPVGRVDRYDWEFNGLTAMHVDCHMFRPAWIDEHWYKINAVLKDLLTEKEVNFCNEYKCQFAGQL